MTMPLSKLLMLRTPPHKMTLIGLAVMHRVTPYPPRMPTWKLVRALETLNQ